MMRCIPISVYYSACMNKWPSLLLLAALSFLCACSKNRLSVADKAVQDRILIIGNSADPQTLDPHLAQGLLEEKIITALFEGLTTYHSTDDNQGEPGVAERWESNPDATRWTFYLRKDAKWSNGDPVTAHDFIYSWKRVLSPELGAEYAALLYYLKNGREYHSGEITDFSQVGCHAVDDHTISVELIGPIHYFHLVLVHYAWFPVHPPTIEKFGGPFNRASQWTRPENFVGNGPFTLTEWTVNNVVRVSANPHYWDKSTVRLKEIRFLPIADAAQEDVAFAGGQLHITYGIVPEKLPYWQSKQPEAVRMEPQLGIFYFMINTEQTPLNDPRIRKALSLAIDRRLITENVTRGGQLPAYGFTPPGLSGYPPLESLHYDPNTARKFLAEAGFPSGKGFPPCSILYNSSDFNRKIAEAIQEMWRKELGIEIQLTNQDWTSYLNARNQRNYTIARASWFGDYPDPITFISLWSSTNGNNQTGWANSLFDSLLNAARMEPNPKKRLSLLREAESLFLEELPGIPVFYFSKNYLIDSRVDGWFAKALDGRPWKRIGFKMP